MIPVGSLKYAIPVLGSVAIIVLFGLWRLEVAETKSLKGEITGLEQYLDEAQKEVDQCVSDKALTEKVSNDYQRSIGSLRSQLNSLRNNPRCIPVQTPSPTDGHNGTTAERKLSGADGLRAGYLLEYAGNAEETRLKLIACQKFVNQLYESRTK